MDTGSTCMAHGGEESQMHTDEGKDIYEDYLEEAKAISRPSSCIIPLGWIGISAVTLFLDYALGHGTPTVTIITTIGYFLMIYLWDSNAKKKIRKIAEKKPGFEEFYSAMSIKKARSELKLIALAAASTGEAIDRKRELKSENIYKNIEESKSW